MLKKILMIVGSMRNQSLNRQLANEAAALLADKAEVAWLDFAELPYMNQDIEYPAPDEVERVRNSVKEADGIWIVTPEYNYSYPGVLKNLLDWLSRPLEAGNFEGPTAVAGKKVTISGAGGKSATAGAREKLTELLKFIRMEVMETYATGISVDYSAFMTNELVLSAKNKEDLSKQANAFLDFLNDSDKKENG